MPEDTTDKNHWTVETLREYMLALIKGNDEKYIGIIASNDVKYLERFEASQVAAGIAFTAQQTAMLTALTAQKLAIDTALAATERASEKAEKASDKRFDGVNELRGMVTDAQATFIQRLEAVALITAINERISAMQTNYENKLEAMRLSFEKSNDSLAREIAGLRESRSEQSGAKTNSSDTRAVIAIGISVILVIIAAAGILVAVLKP